MISAAIDLTDPIFHDEAKATAHMEADRWPDGVFCPHCGSVNVHKMGGKTQNGMFVCYGCNDKFTVRTGTVFERSHIPLCKWLLATRIMAASKKGVGALQLQRMLGLGSYRSAWFLCHRIREAMKPPKVGPIGGQGTHSRERRNRDRRQGKEPRLCEERAEETNRFDAS